MIIRFATEFGEVGRAWVEQGAVRFDDSVRDIVEPLLSRPDRQGASAQENLEFLGRWGNGYTWALVDPFGSP